MGRPYSAELVDKLTSTRHKSLGMELGAVCVKAGIPAIYIAKVFGVTRMTVHSWFRGGSIYRRRTIRISDAIRAIREDLESGKLPIRKTEGQTEPQRLEEIRAYTEQLQKKVMPQ